MSTPKRYSIFLKTTGKHDLLAYGYTRDRKTSSFYFHSSPDLSDRDRFFKCSHVIGIDYDFSDAYEKITKMKHADFNALVEALPRKTKK